LLVVRAWIIRDVQAGNADRAGCPRYFHRLIEDDRRLLLTVMTLRFESDRINEAVDNGLTHDCLHQFTELVALANIDGLKNDFLGMREAFCVGVTDHNEGGPQNAC
jgi:hypothetical protein